MQALYDCHVHTCHSPDSQQPMEEIFQTALAKGLRGIAITDHADMWFWNKEYFFEQLPLSIAHAKEADKRLSGKMRVFCGVELAEYRMDPGTAEKILHLTDYDIVLSSVHCVQYRDWDMAYSKISFDEVTAPEDKLRGFLEVYFQDLLSMAQNNDFDVLTHLTCPLRYINGKYKRDIDVTPYTDLIRQILSAVIKRGKSLEVNTSGIHSFYGAWMPDRAILEQYYAMGGRLITLASDAHTADRVGNAFAETITMLKEIGFPAYYYYDQRIAHPVSWDCL